MTAGLYDLLAAGAREDDIVRWLGGGTLDAVGAPPLSPAERRVLRDAWWFWARPGQLWEPGPEFITDYECGRGFGKAVSLDTPLATPTGWTTMGAVRVGDALLDEQGRPCRVTSTHDVHAAEAWRLTFSDGTYVNACADHLWVTLDQLERKRMNRRLGGMMALWAYAPARTTRDLVATIRRGPRGDLNHCIPLTAPLALPEAALPFPPYALGVWLGDGDSHASIITSHVDDAPHYAARFAAEGFAWETMKTDPRRPLVGRYLFGRRVLGQHRRTCATTRLRALGVWKNKHIPPAYLRASYPQRLALMQGLIDTDGTVDRESGQIEYCTMLPGLAEDVAELARTLGQKPSICDGRAMLAGVDYGTKYRVFWRPTLPVASLPRKLALIQRMGDQSVRNMHRMLVSADPLPPQPMRCVTVDSPASMYLVGRGMVPTHNTRIAAETVCQAANDPERWGGHVMVVGPDPIQVKRDCLFGPSGMFPVAKRRAESGNGPAIADRNLNDRWMLFEPPGRGGKTTGLMVYWAASSDPKSAHGGNLGLVWWDEYGVSYHRRRDEQGNNLWKALEPAVRSGPDPKIIITQTPSRAPEVRALQADAERPECPACRAAALARGPYLGERGKEPWRLPRSPQVTLHPLLNTRTTVPARTCVTCGGTVVAKVRCVFGDTRDNPAIAARAREAAADELATGQAWAFLRFAPRGEVDAVAGGSLVRYEDVRQVDVGVLGSASEPPADAGRPGRHPSPSARAGAPVADRWMQVVAHLGLREVVVAADPAVTAADSSDESGVVAAGVRPATPDPLASPRPSTATEQVVGLQDWTASPHEVAAAGGGAPSLVWAPRAHWLACLWGARRIVVEVNQGGEEVLSAVRDLCRRGVDEAETSRRLREEYFPGASEARVALLARRVSASSRGVVVEAVRRRAPKPARLEWYGRVAALGGQAVLVAEWLGGPRHWQRCLSQGTDYEPPREGQSAGRERKDAFDALCSAAQVLLGVRETHGHDDSAADAGRGGWLGRIAVGPGR